jgi:hypothetical protein
MTKLLALATSAFLFAIPSLLAADEQDLDEYEKRVNRINTLADKPGMMNIALQRISTETGVPIENVRSQHKRFSTMGAAGIMIANVLANETKKEPSDFLKARTEGKKWLAQARQHKVSVDKLNDRLERLQKALTEGGDATEKRNNRNDNQRRRQ